MKHDNRHDEDEDEELKTPSEDQPAPDTALAAVSEQRDERKGLLTDRSYAAFDAAGSALQSKNVPFPISESTSEQLPDGTTKTKWTFHANGMTHSYVAGVHLEVKSTDGASRLEVDTGRGIASVDVEWTANGSPVPSDQATQVSIKSRHPKSGRLSVDAVGANGEFTITSFSREFSETQQTPESSRTIQRLVEYTPGAEVPLRIDGQVENVPEGRSRNAMRRIEDTVQALNESIDEATISMPSLVQRPALDNQDDQGEQATHDSDNLDQADERGNNFQFTSFEQPIASELQDNQPQPGGLAPAPGPELLTPGQVQIAQPGQPLNPILVPEVANPFAPLPVPQVQIPLGGPGSRQVARDVLGVAPGRAPHVWTQFHAFSLPPNLPANAPPGQVMDARRNSMWSNHPPTLNLDVGGSYVQQARALLGAHFGAVVDINNDPIASTSVNNFFSRQYFEARQRNDRQGTELAMRMLELEVRSGENPSAEAVLQSLRFCDAVFDLRAAEASGNLQLQQQALTRLALLERAQFQSAADYLDRWPTRPESGQPEQARQMQLEYARLQARGGDAAVVARAGVSMQGFTGVPASRQQDLHSMEIARATMRPGQHPAFDQNLNWAQAMDSASQMRQNIANPNEFQRHLDLLRQSASRGNTTANMILLRIGVQSQEDATNLVAELREPASRQAAMLRVGQTLAEMERGYADRHAYNSFRAVSPQDILNQYPNAAAVQAARTQAEAWSRENYTAADNQLAALLARDATPAARQTALEALRTLSTERQRRLGTDQHGRVADWAAAAHASLRIQEAPTAQEAATRLQELVNLAATNQQARELLTDLERRLGGNGSILNAVSQMLSDLQAGNNARFEVVRAQLQDRTGTELNDFRVLRIVRRLDQQSTPQNWDSAGAELQREITAGNSRATSWQQWATAQGAVATLNSTTNRQAAEQAVRTLTASAAQNPYARYALVSLGMNNDGAQRWAQYGHDQLNGRPVIHPQLDALQRANSEAAHAVRLAAAESLATVLSASGAAPLNQGEASALSFTLTRISAAGSNQAETDRNTAIQNRIRPLLETAVSATGTTPESSAAFNGVFDAFRSTTQGREALADILLRAVTSPVFAQNFAAINAQAAGADPTALRVVSAVAGGATRTAHMAESAVATLRGVGSMSEHRQLVMESMVTAYRTHGDNNRLLETLGNVAGRDNSIPNSVRLALREGLSSTNAATRTSAANGLMEMAQHWNSQDVQALLPHLSNPDVTSGLQRVADRIPHNFRQTILESARQSLDLTREGVSFAQRQQAIRTIAALGRYATVADVQALQRYGEGAATNTDLPYSQCRGVTDIRPRVGSDAEASQLQNEAGRTLLMLMANAEHPLTHERAFDAFARLSFPGVADNTLRDAMVAYFQGRQPDNLAMLDRIQRLCYDTNLPVPPAGILRHMAGTDRFTNQQNFERAQRAIANYTTANTRGEQVIRDVASRVALWNSLEPSQRREISGSDQPLTSGQTFSFAGRNISADVINMLPPVVREQLTDSRLPLAPGAAVPDLSTRSLTAETFNGLTPSMRRQLTGVDHNINAAQVEAQLVIGTLQDSLNAFLLTRPGQPSLDARLQERLTTQETETARLDSNGARLRREHEQTLTRLNEQTAGGVGFWNRAGSVLRYASPVTMMVLADPVENWANLQASRVARLPELERQIATNSVALHQAEQTRDFLSFSRRIGQIEGYLNDGNRRRADMAGLELLRDYGTDVMRMFAPHIYNDLMTRSGQGVEGRSGLERLQHAGVIPMGTLPNYGTEIPPRFATAITALRGLNVPEAQRSNLGVVALRSEALRMLQADPELNALGPAAQIASQHLAVLSQMFQAGMGGSRYEPFIADCRRRAAAVQEAMAAVTPAQIRQVEQRLTQLRAGLEGMSDPLARQQVTEMIERYQQTLDIFTPGSERRTQLDQMFTAIRSREFNATTFANWLKENGPTLILVTLAVAATVASMGTAAPLAVLLVTSAVALGVSQISKEVLWQVNHRIGDTGLGHIDERSYAGSFVDRQLPRFTAWLSASTGRSAAESMVALRALTSEAQIDWLKTVLGPMALEYGMNVLMGLATMGVVQVGTQGLRSLISPAAWRQTLLGAPAQQLAVQLERAGQIAATNPASRPFFNAWLGRFTREFGSNSGFTVGQEGSQHAVETALHGRIQQGNNWLAFGISAMLALGHARISGAHLTAGRGHEVHVDPRLMQHLVEQCRRDGHTVVSRGNGIFEVRPYSARPGDPPIVMRAQAEMPRQMPHELAAPGPGDHAGPQAGRLLEVDGRWLGQSMQHLRTGTAEGYTAAHQAAANPPGIPAAERARIVHQDVVVNHNNLQPGLTDHIRTMQGAHAEFSNGQVTIHEPRTVIELPSGAHVDILHPGVVLNTSTHQRLSPADVLRIAELRNSPAGQRILAEHAMIMIEEQLHVRQFRANGQPISQSYRDYLQWSGETATEQGTNQRSRRSLEQEIVCALHDGGFPRSLIEAHFGAGAYAERAAVLDYLRQRAAGTLPAQAPPRAHGQEVGVPATPGEPVRVGRDRIQQVTQAIETARTNAQNPISQEHARTLTELMNSGRLTADQTQNLLGILRQMTPAARSNAVVQELARLGNHMDGLLDFSRAHLDNLSAAITGGHINADQLAAMSRANVNLRSIFDRPLPTNRPPELLRDCLALFESAPQAAERILLGMRRPAMSDAVLRGIISDVAARSNPTAAAQAAVHHDAIALDPNMRALHEQLLNIENRSLREAMISQAATRQPLTAEQIRSIGQGHASSPEMARVIERILADRTPDVNRVRAVEEVMSRNLSAQELSNLNRALESRAINFDAVEGIARAPQAAREVILDLAASGTVRDADLLHSIAIDTDARALARAIRDGHMDVGQMQRLLDISNPDHASYNAAHAEHLRVLLRARAASNTHPIAHGEMVGLLANPHRAFERALGLPPEHHSAGNRELVRLQQQARQHVEQFMPHLDADAQASLHRYIREDLGHLYETNRRAFDAQMRQLDWLGQALRTSPTNADLIGLARRFPDPQNSIRIAGHMAGVRNPGQIPQGDLVFFVHGTNEGFAQTNAGQVGQGGNGLQGNFFVSESMSAGQAYSVSGNNRNNPAMLGIALPRAVHDALVSSGGLVETRTRGGTAPDPLVLYNGDIYLQSQAMSRFSVTADQLVHLQIGTEFRFTAQGLATLRASGFFFRVDVALPNRR